MIRAGFLFALLLSAATAQAQLAGLLEPVMPANATFAQNGRLNVDRVVKRLQQDAGHHSLDGETFLRELEKELTTRYGVDGELKLSFVRPWPAVSLPGEDITVTVTEAPSEGLASSFMLKAKVVSSAETVGEWTLAVRAQLLQSMWAVTGRIERGQALDRSQLAAQKVDVLRDRQPFISAEVDPATLETAQPITSPRLLQRRDILERPIVRKGQVVEVVARQGRLAISMKALALESGPAGALIKLRNLESHKEFTGQITHESKVQVLF